MKRWIAVSGLFLGVLFCCGGARGQSGKPFTYAMVEVTGSQSKQTYDLYRKIINLIFEKMGEKVNVVEMSREKIRAGAKSGKVDFTLLPQSEYVDMVNAKVSVEPVLTMTPRGHMTEYRCFVVPKSSGYSGPADMKGKKLPKPDSAGEYYALRWFLKSKGIDMPLEKFFDGYVPTMQEADAFAAVAAGKLDIADVSAALVDFQKYANSGILKKVNVVDCHDMPWPSGPIVWLGKVDQEKLKKFYDVIPKLDSYPEFKQFKPILNIVKLQFYLVAKKDYAEMIKTFNAAKKNGWEAEYNRIKVEK